MANDDKHKVREFYREAMEAFRAGNPATTPRSEQAITRRENTPSAPAKMRVQLPPDKRDQFRGVILLAIATFILVSLGTFLTNPAPEIAGTISHINGSEAVVLDTLNTKLEPGQRLEIIRREGTQLKWIGNVQVDSAHTKPVTPPVTLKIVEQADSLRVAVNDIVRTLRPPFYRLDYQLGRVLVWLLGLLAFLISLYVGWLGILHFRNEYEEKAFRVGVGICCVFLGYLLLATIIPPLTHLGGKLGYLILWSTQAVLGKIGSLVVFITCLMLTLLFVVTEFKFRETFHRIKSFRFPSFRRQEPELDEVNFPYSPGRRPVDDLELEEAEYEIEDIPPPYHQTVSQPLWEVGLDGEEDPQNVAEEPLPQPKKEPVKRAKPKPAAKAKPATQTSQPGTPTERPATTPENTPDYVYPTLDILKRAGKTDFKAQKSEMERKGRILEDKLREFGVEGEVSDVNPGPLITLYEFCPEPGVKISKIVNLADDLAMRMKAHPVRIIAPIPGKEAVGIEIPNEKGQIVYLRDILSSREFTTVDSKLTIALGMDVAGLPFVSDITDMPHLLIAGATGSGKSVCLNTIICSVLFRASPDDVKFLMIDPKRLELSVYNGIPHLVAPIVTQPTEAVTALSWAVAQMEKRYKLLAAAGVRDIDSYNRIVRSKTSTQYRLRFGETTEHPKPLPYLLVIVDELADLMMTSAREIETYLARLAQMARAVGIHLVIATQRPSVDVITGTIKANFPSRIAFQVASKIDSRTILDMNGAEQLLGRGDMLFLPAWRGKPFRLHGSYVSTSEVNRIVEWIKKKNSNWHIEEKISFQEIVESSSIQHTWMDKDEKYAEALQLVIREQQASVSYLQRKLGIGYARAGRLLDFLEADGIVGPNNGSRSRDVLVDQNYLLDLGIPDSELTHSKPKK